MQEKLENLLKQYIGKDLAGKEVRDALIRDIMGLMAQEAKGRKVGATVMTQNASAYDPKTDKVPQRPQSI